MYDEAFKTYEVRKLLIISWENEEMIIQEMMDLVKEIQHTYETS